MPTGTPLALDRETLEDAARRGLSRAEVAAECGCTALQVAKWCRRHRAPLPPVRVPRCRQLEMALADPPLVEPSIAAARARALHALLMGPAPWVRDRLVVRGR